ncbi:MAG: ABC transporter ATP-binding protein [Clostridia bacterium]
MSIILKDVSFGYTKKKLIFNNYNLQISEGAITAINGANGAGKTTLSKILLGLLKVKGQVIIDGVAQNKISKSIGYVFQNPDLQLFCSTVFDEFYLPLKFIKTDKESFKNRVDEIVKKFDLQQYLSLFPLTLSMGEKQKIAIALALINDNKYYVFDEPTAYLDNEQKEFFTKIILQLKQNGAGVVLISHENYLLNLADTIVNLEAQNED